MNVLSEKEKSKIVAKKTEEKNTVKKAVQSISVSSAKPVKEKAKAQKTEKVKKEKTEQSKKLDKVKAQLRKQKLPVFRGRFGKKWLRRKSMEKWQKWRYPRGIDVSLKKEDGFMPVIGFRTPKKLRFLHPSALNEILVNNVNEVLKANENNAIRISSAVGKKLRKQIYLKAKELGLKVLNRGKI